MTTITPLASFSALPAGPMWATAYPACQPDAEQAAVTSFERRYGCTPVEVFVLTGAKVVTYFMAKPEEMK